MEGTEVWIWPWIWSWMWMLFTLTSACYLIINIIRHWTITDTFLSGQALLESAALEEDNNAISAHPITTLGSGRAAAAQKFDPPDRLWPLIRTVHSDVFDSAAVKIKSMMGTPSWASLGNRFPNHAQTLL